jgi:hypothetical protein
MRVIGKDGTVEVLTEIIDAKEPKHMVLTISMHVRIA